VFEKLRSGSDGNGSLQGFLHGARARPQRSAVDRKAVPKMPARVLAVGRSHTHRIRVRYGECDPSGVVFNANYFGYFDLALTELWREAAGGYGAMMEEGVDLQVVEATARYKAPARFDDELDVTVEVTSLGNTSMLTSYAIQRDGTLLVEGELAYVFVHATELTKLPIPARFREALGA
jgi:acyl-CoA thioester hydrolase